MRAIKLSLVALWLTSIASTSASISTIDPGTWTNKWFSKEDRDGDTFTVALARDGDLLAVDIKGWYTNPGYGQLWKIDPLTKNATVLVGSPTARGGNDGNGTDATIFAPWQFVDHPTELDGLIFTDTSSVRKVNVATGQVTTLVGAPSGSTAEGFVNAVGTAARFNIVYGIARHDLTGSYYFSERHGRRIRRADPHPVTKEPYEVHNFAGHTTHNEPSQANTDGQWGNSRFYDPRTISMRQSNGEMFVPDYGGNRLRQVTIYSEVSTPNTVSQMVGCTLTPDERYLYCTRWHSVNQIIRFDFAISLSAYDMVVNVQSVASSTSNERTPLGTTHHPHQILMSPGGDKLYCAQPTYGTGMSIGLLEFDTPHASLPARPPPLPAVDIGNFTNPWFVTANADSRVSHSVGVLNDGRVLYLDRGRYSDARTQFRVLDPATMEDSYVAGSSNTRGANDGVGGSATINIPRQMVRHPTEWDAMIFADYAKVRKVNVATGRVTTLVGAPSGSQTIGYGDGTGTSARFNYCAGLARYEATGDWFITELYGRRVRRATSDSAGQPRVVYKFAGHPSTNQPTPESKDGTGSDARFYDPRTIAMKQSNGEFYVADYIDNKLRYVTQNRQVSTPNSWVPSIISCAMTTNERYMFCSQWMFTNAIIRFDLTVGVSTYETVVGAANLHGVESNEDTSLGAVEEAHMIHLSLNSDRLYIAQHRRGHAGNAGGPTLGLLELDEAQTYAPTPAPPVTPAPPPATLPEDLYSENCGKLAERAQQRGFSDRRSRGV